MSGKRIVMIAMPLVGLVAGLIAAFIWPTQHGAGHSCPAGAPFSACVYPPNLVRQRIEWSFLGLLAGSAVSWLVWVLSTKNLPRTPRG